MSLLPDDKKVLERYPRAVMHLRDRRRVDRLALCLGAGVSKDFGFPTWTELVERLEREAKVPSKLLPHSRSLTLKTQAVLQYLRGASGSIFPGSAESERELRSKWIGLVHKALYETVHSDPKSLSDNHPYISDFLELIRCSPLTINYNFDDAIERILGHVYSREQAASNERVYETVWEPSTQFNRSRGVIYHPNGFLPQSLVDGFSDQLVFTEGEFGDQLLDVMSGHYATLTAHLTRHTSLFIGLSLSDSTLKHMLRQNVHLNPGHVHYYVRHCESEGDIPTSRLDAETMANFDVYGVITLHLTRPAIASLGRLLSCPDWEFQEALDDRSLESKYVFYISGPVGAGKTSVVQRLKSLTTLAEWIDPRPPSLQKAHHLLTAEERESLDRWISDQFRRKNFKLAKSPDGLVACDRSPLDPLAFVDKTNRAARAAKHLSAIQRPDGQPLLPGQVILLTASAEELMARAKERHKGGDHEYLRLQQAAFEELHDYDGVEIVSTASRSLHEVVRAVCRIIHLGEYRKNDLAAALQKVASVPQ